MGRIMNLTGRRFGRLVVLERAENEKDGRAKWNCICDCGSHCVVAARSLVSGNTQSCGCFQKEKTSGATKSHGMRHSRLYQIWTDMKTRCTNKNYREFYLYGGRGITVCAEWSESFEAFRDWALANGYRDDLTIDRIDVDGNYEPSNCRWATKLEQQSNKRNNRLLTAFGETHTESEWSRITGINVSTIYARLKRGWSVERTLTEEVKNS